MNKQLADTLTKQAKALEDLADELESLKSDVWDVSLAWDGSSLRVMGPDCHEWGKMPFLQAIEELLDDGGEDVTKQVKKWMKTLTAAQELLANYLPPQLTPCGTTTTIEQQWTVTYSASS